MNTFIFRKYDIRGVVKDDFPKDVVVNIGKAFGTFVIRSGDSKISISGDIRHTTPRLKRWFTQGLLEAGINVFDLGIIPTPTNYYSMFHLDIDGAVQITGSHNPPDYNGFKLSYKKRAFYGDQIQELKSLIEKKDFEKSNNGQLVVKDILGDYMKMLKDKINISKPLKVVMDCGNAAACLVAPKIYPELGIEVTELFCNPDGNFPNHHPDPTEDKNLVDIISNIKEGEYDFGVAYDGDADRVVIIDEKGKIIRSDILMAIFLPEVMEKGEEIVFDVKCSQALEDMIIKYGGKPLMWKTGHSLIKDKMQKNNIKFAGEMSGHIFFSDDYFGYDDAIYVSLRLAQLLSIQEKTLSELTSVVPKYYSTPELRLECYDDNEKFMIAKKAFQYFSTNYECITVDGVRIKFDDGWGLVRASNTQPVIVCRFEAKTKSKMLEIQQEILNKLGEFGEISIDN